MAQFPKKEIEIRALIEKMISGYGEYPAEFPNADVPGLVVVYDEYRNKKAVQIWKEAWVHLLTETKDIALDALVVKMVSELKQSEVDTSADPKQLELIGWTDKQTPAPSAPPGQPRMLEITAEGAGTIDLDWKTPAPGPFGEARAYVILRRVQSATGFSPWLDATITVATRVTLSNQPLRTQLEYRVVAMNAAGTSVPSNSVAAVL
ncbi:MAG TPA: fibronectin type III domain-containing protein [Candidatus Bathyarchaeia archaeon]|nr:fibronectin type III domain-containing protein [Candidatus Bathyarchaeia archaeon]